MSFLPDALALIIGYLLGSIPFGLLLTRVAGTADLRSIGSGNIGATNVLRTGRKDLAAATLLLDALKGTVAVLIGAKLSPQGAMIAAFAAFVGHIAPVWLGFKGGKGVATFLGCLFALHWPTGLAFCGVWLSVAAITRYSSLSALVASVAAPILLFVLGHGGEAFVVSAMAALLWRKHAENIARLRAGTESRIGQKS
ncbi:glycerol-3-phosphate 1-O-acyltransferase PlsY [Methylocystis parvus]|uniref:Glycerol-3-phosphate acyltransferase n=1 Tax=Methylocystis parvus TaxID=134 RepID=A0A6B8M8M2_9HYPH|nr:glycerol-3-phosphate 1-O-acyltransferase PlsY [Methylocystis parvus]QGM98946.1 glycerol-3-phosphate 1-O-acyltransferase PlsY [Methylocystis parvus]WBK00696.1 glycerol-3-phosphate 1-O-acyltransferase PlsY [Methylocystis parvus OBBP]